MISIVLPTWNEAQNLPGTLVALSGSSPAHEIIVVDAGSIDRTCECAREFGAQVILSDARQRAAQMNLGAKNSSGSVLLFLHADTLLPRGALARVEMAMGAAGVGGGGFARKFADRSLFLKMTCLLAELRNRTIGWHLGDQAMFVRRGLFEELGGFKLRDRFEDLDFSRRLGRIARVVTLRPPVISSARRFVGEGPVKRTVRDFLLTLRYWTGASD